MSVCADDVSIKIKWCCCFPVFISANYKKKNISFAINFQVSTSTTRNFIHSEFTSSIWTGKFSLHHYVTYQFIWVKRGVPPSDFPFFLFFPPISSIHHIIPHLLSLASHFLLIICHLLPSYFTAICLHTVCASRKFPLCPQGELRFSLLCSSLVPLLYVFHTGKASSSCMQQGVCSVCGCPIRDPPVWCYNLPIYQDPLTGCSFLSFSTRLSCPYFFLPLLYYTPLTDLLS